jgi:hypothetical protein
MSNEPFRMPRSVHRDDDEQSDATHRHSDESNKVEKESQAMNRARNSFEDSKSKLPVVVAAFVVVVLLVAAAGWWAMTNVVSSGGIDTSKYQAVFFTNGQVYFGKLHDFNNDYLKLSDVYYLQATQADSKNPQKTGDQQTNNVQLIKLGQEIHGPQDEMIVAKNQVLFYENLKSDGKVSQSIDQYKKSNK